MRQIVPSDRVVIALQAWWAVTQASGLAPGASATGLEADGPPDAMLTHRLALIAKADR